MGVINMAHGELMAMGAYATYLVSVAFQHWAPVGGGMDIYLFVAIPLAFLATWGLSVAQEGPKKTHPNDNTQSNSSGAPNRT